MKTKVLGLLLTVGAGSLFLFTPALNSQAATWPKTAFPSGIPTPHGSGGLYHGSCPAGDHGAYAGGGNLYCHR
ncbi:MULTISPECIES: hypothetical protein [Lactiplantibacillus]|nr:MULTISPECIES: hypothetical protein [Lactiplantibacillus]MBU7448854.1 hypothetical protein [Lactiplantibacillus sp. 7.2.4]MBU7479991.1 hypothetical protein [Lactiplantibacillus pentosus]